MNVKLTLLLFFLLSSDTCLGSNSDSLFLVLDRAIAEHQQYVDIREGRISLLKAAMWQTAPDAPDRYRINKELYREYKAYICDSAICYLNRNLLWAAEAKDDERSNETKLLLVYLLASAGMYQEATDLLPTVKRELLAGQQLVDYYASYHHTYHELGFYTQDQRSRGCYNRLAAVYKDSLRSVLPPSSGGYMELQEGDLRLAGHCEEALAVNDKRLSEVRPGSSEYALVTYQRALIYRKMKQLEQEKYFLTLSALSDIQLSIKDHAALWNLAQLLYEGGDIERAYQYIRFSWSETNDYNARSRSLQTAGILSLIDLTYQAMREKQNDALRFYLSLISVLSLLLIVAIAYIYRQMKRLGVARNRLEQFNEQLKALNRELQQMNLCLQSTNQHLSESNHIKEEYIGRFINLCSTYIDKLDVYRRMVNKKISTGQIDELLKMVRSPKMLDDGLKELYANFDSAFLNLFPDFVNSFNGLLVEEERIVLRKGELLNTELRIFALIRLGIADSSQIAEFLRYSVNTIYNYRAKVKSKSRISRDDFETQVMMIK